MQNSEINFYVVYKEAAMRINKDRVEKWDIFELTLYTDSLFENPFRDVELSAVFKNGPAEKRVEGFHDGDGTWKIRFMPERTGMYSFVTESNIGEFNGLEGSFSCVDPSGSNRGPVNVSGKFHFNYADGTPCYIMGTTAYAWTYRPPEVREETLRSFAKYGFNKIRMLFSPKYLAGFTEIDLTYDPPVLPFKGEKNNWDYSRFNIEYFRNFEDRVRELRDLDIIADVILFHNYDFGMWGIDDGMSDDDGIFYLKYLMARISSFRNVWWSLANEYELYKAPDGSGARVKYDRRDWDRLGKYIMENDPYNHPRSIHNYIDIYPDRDWLTHVSYQSPNTYTLLLDLKYRYQKPVIADEYRYEGNLSYGWGNLTGKEALFKHWLSVMASGYATHGECYVIDGNKKDIFWTYGGEMVGESAPRLRFLKEIIDTMCFREMEPDHNLGDGMSRFCIRKGYETYFYLLTGDCGFRKVRFGPLDGRKFTYRVTVYDTWECRVIKQENSSGWFGADDIPGMIAIKAEKTNE
jgi:hypothetical protein